MVSTKWRNLLLLTFGELLAMALWFSASAVVPQLTDEWRLSGGQQAWLTMSVQAGFVVGALISALLNLADRISAQRLVAVSAMAGAVANAALTAVDDPGTAIALRLLTGLCLAGVYPPGMKLVASWTRADRGLGIGLLVGALTVGSAAPHLINALPFLGGAAGMPPWQNVLLVASACAAVGALTVGFLVSPGGELPRASRFNWRYATRALSERPSRLANFGYLGHMWELYAMWSWVPVLLLTSYQDAGWSDSAARVAGFGAIAAGGLGSLAAGRWADRWGRTTVTIASLTASGACCLVAGLLIDSPAALTALCLVWGFAVVADSAQFSTAVSELADPEHVGTALTVQTSLGFLLTMVSIWMIPPLVERVGWQWAFASLALGPVFGIVSMAKLRALPEASKMASGNR